VYESVLWARVMSHAINVMCCVYESCHMNVLCSCASVVLMSHVT